MTDSRVTPTSEAQAVALLKRWQEWSQSRPRTTPFGLRSDTNTLLKRWQERSQAPSQTGDEK